MITLHDLNIKLSILNTLLETDFSIETYSGSINPYRIIDGRQQVIHGGTRNDLYNYLCGAIEGINSFKVLHNMRSS